MFRPRKAEKPTVQPAPGNGVQELRRALYEAERGNVQQARIHLKRALVELKEVEAPGITGR